MSDSATTTNSRPDLLPPSAVETARQMITKCREAAKVFRTANPGIESDAANQQDWWADAIEHLLASAHAQEAEIQRLTAELALIRAWTLGESVPHAKMPGWFWDYMSRKADIGNTNAMIAIRENEAAIAWKARAEVAERERDTLRQQEPQP